MDDPNTEFNGPAPADGPRRAPPWLLPVVGGVVAIALVVGLILWATRDDNEITGGTSAPNASTDTTTAATESSTSVAPPSSAPTSSPTSAPTSVTQPTLAPATTSPDTAPGTPSGPTGDTWTVTSVYFPGEPFVLERIVEGGGVSVYDGEINSGSLDIRCVAVVFDGRAGWSEWCGDAFTADQFVVLDGIDPLVVELGEVHGDVTVAQQEPTWKVPSNGCSGAFATIAGAAPPSPAAFTGLVCVPGEAFLTYSQVFLQPGPADGGGMLIVEGDEGWNTTGGGTSIDCAGWPDGVDRCALFGVQSELFEANLPIPPLDLLTRSPDIVGVTDRTAEVRRWIGDAVDPAVVEATIAAELVDPAAEVAATVRRSDLLWFGLSSIVVIEVPALDDSVQSETWAVWVGDGDRRGSLVIRATSWTTCARGIAGPDLCV